MNKLILDAYVYYDTYISYLVQYIHFIFYNNALLEKGEI